MRYIISAWWTKQDEQVLYSSHEAACIDAYMCICFHLSYACKFTAKVALALMNMLLGLLLKKIIPLHLLLKRIPKWCLL